MPSRDAAPLPQPAPASSHDRILQAAKQLFAGRGYENTSTVGIARLAGTSESQLMKHFGSKEGLLEAIFEQGWQKMGYLLRSIHALSSPADKLQALLELVLKALERDPELKQLLLLEGRRVRKEGAIVLLTKGYLEFIAVLDGILGEMRAADQLRPDLSLQAVRSGLIGLFEGLMRDQILGQRLGYPAMYSTEEMRQLFSVVVDGLSANPSRPISSL